jgi:hypothetical protein
MYCPRCARPLTLQDEVWRCERGEMELSRSLGLRLAARFATGGGEEPAADSSAPVGGHWYCPACGVPMDGDARCPACMRSLRTFLFELVELHPHADAGSRDGTSK